MNLDNLVASILNETDKILEQLPSKDEQYDFLALLIDALCEEQKGL